MTIIPSRHRSDDHTTTLRVVEASEITEEFRREWAKHTDDTDTRGANGAKIYLETYVDVELRPDKERQDGKIRVVLALQRGKQDVFLRVVYVVTRRCRTYIESGFMITPRKHRSKGYAVRVLELLIKNKDDLGLGGLPTKYWPRLARALPSQCFLS